MPRDLMNNYSGIKVEIEINKENYESELYDNLTIDDTDLDKEFVEQPRLFAWWAAVETLIKDLYETKKTQLKRDYAVIDARVREEGKITETRLTEKMIENTVITDPKYQIAENELAEIRKQFSLAHVGKEAFEQRKEMLISLGANRRSEVSANPIVKKEKNKIEVVHTIKEREQEKQEQKSKSVLKRKRTKKKFVGKSVGKKKKGDKK
jgi:hypothetical protein